MSRKRAPLVILVLFLCLFILSPATADDATTLYQQALDLYYKGKNEDALTLVEKSLALNAKSSNSWNLKGMILNSMGRYQDAVNAYDEAIALKPTSHIAYNNKGNALKNLVRYEEALEAYNKALAINPTYVPAYTNRGNLFSRLGRYDEAVKSLESALSYDPHYSLAWYSLGLVYQKMDRHQDAVVSFDKAIAEDPGYKEAYYAKGVSLVKLGQTDAAGVAFNRVLELDPSHADAKNQLNQIAGQKTENTELVPNIPFEAGSFDLGGVIIIILVLAGATGGLLIWKFRGSLIKSKGTVPITPSPSSPEYPVAPLPGTSGREHKHDIFISYSSKDKPVADAVCAHLEARKIKCWIAPRDLLPGILYQEGIIRAIEESRIMVFIFSSHSNSSPHIIRELTKAVSSGVIIIPFRIEDILPSKAMEYLISAPHWLDAITPPLEAHIRTLGDTIEGLLHSAQETGEKVS